MKIIKTPQDLAINGAPPAFDKVLHVGSPNMGDRAIFDQYVDRIFESNWLTNNGPLVQEFEKEIAAYLGVKHVVAMCNGTIALEIAIRALGLTGEVIVPSYTFIATAHALHWQGIKPIFADIDPTTHNLDPASVEKMITPATTGIIGVHLWGRPAPIDELRVIADRHNLSLMFDAAHAFGCTYQGTPIGNFGECEVLSFHATKFFNSFEGGAVVTNNAELAEAMRLMRNFGFAGLDNVIHPGTNGKMTEVCAAMGLSNWLVLEQLRERNLKNYRCYGTHFEKIEGINLLQFDEVEQCNYQYIVAEIAPYFPLSRDEITSILHSENILVRRYFWPGCHQMLPYRDLQSETGTELPSTTVVSERVLVFPTGSSVNQGYIDQICEILRFLANAELTTRSPGPTTE